jgi:pimeloyl-ACP methyl ester carboxylesterase
MQYLRTIAPILALAAAQAAAAPLLPIAREATVGGRVVAPASRQQPAVMHRTAAVRGLDLFYREAGDKDAPVIVLLHGFPTSSHMFRDLIPELARDFRVIAPDYPGFGNSSAPPTSEYDYTFENISLVVEDLLGQLGVTSAAFYVMDYGAPVGFRIAERNPELVHTFIIQNGNAYDEGLLEFWDPIKAYWNAPTPANREALAHLVTRDATVWQYTNGTRNPQAISPDTWNHDQPLLDRPQSKDIQLDLFYDYRTNVEIYPRWQAYFREHQPRALIVWGRNDVIFPSEGAFLYARDLKRVQTHLLDTGHFALEEDGDLIADLIRRFLATSK